MRKGAWLASCWRCFSFKKLPFFKWELIKFTDRIYPDKLFIKNIWDNYFSGTKSRVGVSGWKSKGCAWWMQSSFQHWNEICGQTGRLNNHKRFWKTWKSSLWEIWDSRNDKINFMEVYAVVEGERIFFLSFWHEALSGSWKISQYLEKERKLKKN